MRPSCNEKCSADYYADGCASNQMISSHFKRQQLTNCVLIKILIKLKSIHNWNLIKLKHKGEAVSGQIFHGNQFEVIKRRDPVISRNIEDEI